MILRNHGLLAAGRTIPEAFVNIYYLERACQAQIKAQSGGAALNYPREAVRSRTADQFQRDGVLAYGEMAWQAALRLLNPSVPPTVPAA
jgi:ribulose-5-phosphate 4-epimerase/fuculose-1-phosphate aldolase